MTTLQDLIDYHHKAAREAKYDAQVGERGGCGHLDARVSYDFHLDAAALLEKLNAESKLATAPEEPVVKDSLTTEPDPEKPTIAKSATVEPVSTPNELKNQNKENTHSLSRWRHLGHHETICDGDEYYSYGHGRFMTLEKGHPHIGAKPSEKHYVKFRTRRALQKQEEMPLEGEITSIEWSCAHTARAMRYLRDQIQKLKAK